MATCDNCNIIFTKKSGNKGLYRFSLEKQLPYSGEFARTALENVTGAKFTPASNKSGSKFLCPSCWSSLNDTVKYQHSMKKFWAKTDEETYIGSKRKQTDTEFDSITKKPRFTSTPKAKKGPRKTLFSPRKNKFNKWDPIITAVRARQYGRAIKGLFNATPGSKRKFLQITAQIIRKEVGKILSIDDFPLCQEAAIPTISDFSWEKTFTVMEQHAPLLFTSLKSAVTSKQEEESHQRKMSVNLKPMLGTILSCLFHAKAPRKASFFPTVMSIQFWRGGLKRETIKQLAHTGICLGYNATLKAVDKIRDNFDAAANTIKRLLEEELEGDTEGKATSTDKNDVELSEAIATTSHNIEDEINSPSDYESDGDLNETTLLYSDEEWDGDDISRRKKEDKMEEEDDDIELVEEDDKEFDVGAMIKEESAHLEAGHEIAGPSNRDGDIPMDIVQVDESKEGLIVEQPKYTHELQPVLTLCWDNVGKKVITRHPTQTTTNTYINMALGYMAVNRVPSTELEWDDSNTQTKALNIPIDTFIPDDKDLDKLRNTMKTIVGRIISRHIPWVKNHFGNCSTPHIIHEKSTEMSRKSILINLGVFDENPSSTQGAIGIYEKLQQYVPSINSKPYPTLVFGDGLSCERGNDAQKARLNGLNQWERLEGLEPAAQEFHKEMILLQDFFDEFFKGASAADRGTLCQLKNMFNFRKVKADISDNFANAWELMCMVTESFVCLFAKKLLKMDDQNSRPKDAPSSIENATQEDKNRYFDSICTMIVKKVWHEIDTKVLKTAMDEGPPLYCCGEEIEDELIGCEERANCPNGEIFHYSCAGVDPDNLPEPWYCSEECRNRKSFYRYCHCHEDLGSDIPMIGCAAESSCKGSEWYHFQCIDISSEDPPEGDWFCTSECESATFKSKRKVKDTKKGAPPVDPTDYIYNYSRALVWCGLNLLCRRDAVREGDGESMVSYWKLDLVHFFNRRHPKYLILAHRLIVSVNGWRSEKLKNDIIWNRTVNYGGGIGRNLPMYLMNEILNRLFKDLLDAAKGRYTPNTLQRCGQIVGPLGESLDAVFDSNLIENELYRHRRRAQNRDENVGQLVHFLEPIDLFSIHFGRLHKAFPNFHHSETPKHPGKFPGKMKQLSKKLDLRRAAILDD